MNKKVPHKNIFLDFFLIILSGGFWNIWMQYRQIRDYNTWFGHKEFSFIKWLILTILTCGLYHAYHEYKLTRRMYEHATNTKTSLGVGLLAGIISLTGMWVFVDLYQQTLLNILTNTSWNPGSKLPL